MYPLPQVVLDLTTSFSSLPGLGKKTAQRLVQHLLSKPQTSVQEFGSLLLSLHEKVAFCKSCFSIMDQGRERCLICEDPLRQQDVLCVVESFLDVIAIEETGAFKGTYHVLQGVLSPLDGIGPEALTIAQLLHKVNNTPEIREVLLATNPTMEGETTALYIKNILKDREVVMTRIAKGMPMGGSIDYADGMTLGNALEKRVVY